MKSQGYLWNYFGFTRLHLWGVHIVCSAFAALGTATLVLAILTALEDPLDPKVLVLLKCSGVSFLGCIAVTATSILALVFFWGAHQIGLIEKKSEKASIENQEISH